MEKFTIELTPQDIADLRYLVTVAVWIRSEQMANEHLSFITIPPNGVNSVQPPVTISNDMLNLRRALNDFEEGRLWWRKLSAALKGLPEEKAGPSWHKPEDLV